jgi:hypothetical protein
MQLVCILVTVDSTEIECDIFSADLIFCYVFRVKRGRGAIGSRMDEPGPFLDPSRRQGREPNPDTLVEDKWERRVQGLEKPLFLKSKSPDDHWRREGSEDEKPSSSETYSKKEKKRKTDKKDERGKKKKKDNKFKHRHHHRHKSRRD